jgi:hypothetical protein
MPKIKSDTEAPQKVQRLSLPLKEDGSGFDWDQMRSGTKRRLAEIVAGDVDRIISEGGLEIPQTAGGEENSEELNLLGGITEENIKTGIDLVAQAGVLAFKIAGPRFLKHPFKKTAAGKPLPLKIDDDILAYSFRFTEEQHAELDPRALRLAKKHSQKLPDWLKRNLDLYMLMLMFCKYQANNAMTAVQTQIKRDVLVAQKAAERSQPAPPPETPPNFIPPVSAGPENGQTTTAGVV